MRNIRTLFSWRNGLLVLVVVAVGIAGFFIGRMTAATSLPRPSKSLRLSGYAFISPLLACNVYNPPLAQKDAAVTQDVQSIITAHLQAGDISKASVYFLNLTTGDWADVDPATYYPSSLGKIPIMIAYYQEAENDPSILDQAIYYPPGGTNLNLQQDITPPQSITPGQSYAVEQLIEYMVKYSDNNAAQLLYTNIDQDTLNSVYEDLNIPTNENPTLANLDFITPHRISTLFRVLYNATYLSRDYSEQALKLMSQSSFTQGIVAGVASSTVVSHKMGLVGIAPSNVLTEHELHDCGIVYANDPYLLCVMTRGSAPLPTLESIIAQISSAVYQHVQSGA